MSGVKIINKLVLFALHKRRIGLKQQIYQQSFLTALTNSAHAVPISSDVIVFRGKYVLVLVINARTAQRRHIT